MRFFSWQKNMLMGVLVSIAMLLLVEALARVVETVEQDVTRKTILVQEEWFIYSPTLGWERKPGYRGIAGLYARDFDRAGYFAVDSKQIADTKKKKIIFIGDSNTFGYGVPTQSSFVEVVEGASHGCQHDQSWRYWLHVVSGASVPREVSSSPKARYGNCLVQL
jgi:hypothetical protein